MRWRPAQGKHAIDSVVATLAFTVPVPAKIWSGLLLSASQKAAELGFQKEVQEFSAHATGGPANSPVLLQLGPNGLISPKAGTAVGRAYQAVQGDVLLREISFHPESISFISYSYNRWADYIELINNFLETILSRMTDIADISSVILEYTDRFVFSPNLSDDDQSLFRTDKGFISQRFADNDHLWHNHIGYFDRDSNDMPRLINANVDVIQQKDIHNAPSRAAVIRTRAEQRFELIDSLGTWGNAKWKPLTLPQVASVLDEQHRALKLLLENIISPEAAKKIGMGG